MYVLKTSLQHLLDMRPTYLGMDILSVHRLQYPYSEKTYRQLEQLQ